MPQAIRWGHIPIRVSFDRAGYEDYSMAIDGAIEMWNRSLGFKALTYCEANEPPDVAIIMEYERGNLASTEMSGQRALIRTGPMDTIDIAYFIMAHELGHVLGLAHSNVGIMTPGLNREMLFLEPEPYQITALRNRFMTIGEP
jgi:predicted Zn-dependent protease